MNDGRLDARPRRVLTGAAIVVALVARLGFAFGYWTDQPLTHDEREYLSLAANLAQGRGFAPDLPGEPRPERADTFDRAPLYPIVLAPLTWFDASLRDGRLPASVPAAIRLAQSLAGILVVLGAAALATRAGGERAGVVAAWLAALHPALTWIPAYALSEAVFVPLVIGAIAVVGRALDRPAAAASARTELRDLAAGGVLTGLAVLARPSTLVAVPLVALFLLGSRRVRPALAFAAGVTLAIAPWAVPNSIAHGRVVVVSAQGGVNFWIGNHPKATGDGDLAANPQLKVANLELRARHPHLTPVQLEPVYYREAFDWIRSEPVAWAGLLARKAYYTVVPTGPSYRLHSPLYFWASVVPYLALLPLAVAGARAATASPAPPVALGLFVLSSLVSSVLFFPHERFRIAIVDPALVVMAAVWLARTREGAPDRR